MPGGKLQEMCESIKSRERDWTRRSQDETMWLLEDRDGGGGKDVMHVARYVG